MLDDGRVALIIAFCPLLCLHFNTHAHTPYRPPSLAPFPRLLALFFLARRSPGGRLTDILCPNCKSCRFVGKGDLFFCPRCDNTDVPVIEARSHADVPHAQSPRGHPAESIRALSRDPHEDGRARRKEGGCGGGGGIVRER